MLWYFNVLKALNCLLLIGGIGIQNWPPGYCVYCGCVGIYCRWHSEGIDTLFSLLFIAAMLSFLTCIFYPLLC